MVAHFFRTDQDGRDWVEGVTTVVEVLQITMVRDENDQILP